MVLVDGHPSLAESGVSTDRGETEMGIAVIGLEDTSGSGEVCRFASWFKRFLTDSSKVIGFSRVVIESARPL